MTQLEVETCRLAKELGFFIKVIVIHRQLRDLGFSHEGLGQEANLNKWLDSLDQQFDQAKNIWNCLDLYFVKILLS